MWKKGLNPFSLSYFCPSLGSLNFLPRICHVHSSVVKESACSAGDASSIPGSGRSTGEGTGYSLQYSWASLVAHLVKNPPAVWETWVRSLGWEYLLEKGRLSIPISGLENSMDCIVHGVAKIQKRVKKEKMLLIILFL